MAKSELYTPHEVLGPRVWGEGAVSFFRGSGFRD